VFKLLLDEHISPEVALAEERGEEEWLNRRAFLLS